MVKCQPLKAASLMEWRSWQRRKSTSTERLKLGDGVVVVVVLEEDDANGSNGDVFWGLAGSDSSSVLK